MSTSRVYKSNSYVVENLKNDEDTGNPQLNTTASNSDEILFNEDESTLKKQDIYINIFKWFKSKGIEQGNPQQIKQNAFSNEITIRRVQSNKQDKNIIVKQNKFKKINLSLPINFCKTKQYNK